ncbi:hypothetical protein [Nostoc sp. C117]|uniref:hypothetical protein n=1 Tax=Nostoc sp. C117 TaxID=3349875 RepID=UPI00370D3089
MKTSLEYVVDNFMSINVAKNRIVQPVIKLEEFQQGRILAEEMGLLTALPPDLVELSTMLKDIIGNSKVVRGVSAGDYNSLIMFSAIYWGIVKTFPRTVIRNTRRFLTRFNLDKSKNSSRDLLFIFNFTNTQRTKILDSIQNGISGIYKDYGFEEGSHMDYWKELMNHLGIMIDSKTGKLSQAGSILMNQVENAEPVKAIDIVINKEFDDRDALIGMLAVEFLAVGASESIIDSPGSQALFDFQGKRVPKSWFDVHYNTGDQHLFINDINVLSNGEIPKLHLPHDIIGFNMAKIAHNADHNEENFHQVLHERVLKIAKMFASAGDFMYELDGVMELLVK